MEKGEILHTRLGEMLEMIDCHAIASGSATPKNSTAMTYDEVMELR